MLGIVLHNGRKAFIFEELLLVGAKTPQVLGASGIWEGGHSRSIMVRFLFRKNKSFVFY